MSAEAERRKRQRPSFSDHVATGSENLAAIEQSVFRRMSPARNRWPEIARFDERVAELEARQRDVTEELRQVNDKIATVDAIDAQALAQWELGDRSGPRPESKRPGLEEAAERLRRTYDGLTAAVSEVLREKAEYVEKHRRRLVRQADDATREAHERVLGLIDELARARADLAGFRAEALWASCYDKPAAQQVPPNVVAGGSRRVCEPASISGPVSPDRLFAVLRADADWLRDAMTPEQRAIAEGRDPRDQGAAMWAGTPEAIEADRAERREALEAYKRMWGRYPA